ncbi:hypothetical protein TREMEDRAFT_58274 [Tremella mesenterica DSM 1558]|uniref:uncharacterized protein n=1 Tax=Tremella mesenterica (strain ATCC 24925 / CBS 8224 / DSM 1558 / NBRC 9311 / NRRL Y-6157 / RJB 2259-6 / UBC 559-6) TaxID=578456 RepID=UPI0003F4A4F8|nr:uncharacterized protein TREMEDRAFT_58274 [Tremella mesenterica DSM 1558]EIW72120.1 hypothetical protein TREMEDRAFT_58274 [Tremella mesenterica DSM 1558]
MSDWNPQEWTKVHSLIRHNKWVRPCGRPGTATLYKIDRNWRPVPHLDSFFALSRSIDDRLTEWAMNNLNVEVVEVMNDTDSEEQKRKARETMTSTVMTDWYVNELILAERQDAVTLISLSEVKVEHVLLILQNTTLSGRFTWEGLKSTLRNAAIFEGIYNGAKRLDLGLVDEEKAYERVRNCVPLIRELDMYQADVEYWAF